jgi:hypothetical protein
MTLADLLEHDLIVSIVVPLAAREQPMRLVYGTPDFVRWLDERIRSNDPSPLHAETTPAEQLDSLLYAFIAGHPLLPARQFRPIKTEPNPIWELKTPDLRVFGWFAAKDCFICAFGDWADRIKDHDLYRGYRLETRRLRRELGLGNADSVQGSEPADVLSDR